MEQKLASVAVNSDTIQEEADDDSDGDKKSARQNSSKERKFNPGQIIAVKSSNNGSSSGSVKSGQKSRKSLAQSIIDKANSEKKSKNESVESQNSQ